MATKAEKFLFWIIIACIIGCLVVFNLLQNVQDKAQDQTIMELKNKIELVERQNKKLALQYVDLYRAVTPTHELPMLALNEEK